MTKEVEREVLSWWFKETFN